MREATTAAAISFDVNGSVSETHAVTKMESAETAVAMYALNGRFGSAGTGIGCLLLVGCADGDGDVGVDGLPLVECDELDVEPPRAGRARCARCSLRPSPAGSASRAT